MTATTTEPVGGSSQRKAQEEYARDIAEVGRLFPGPDYREVLSWIHRYGRPRNYLEIGVNFGRSFALAGPDTRAVGVDPQPNLDRPATGLVLSETSDAFFARSDLDEILGSPVRFAFIDGLHTFDQVLSDFLNVERVASRDSIVALHDVYPIAPEVATRARRRIFWTGDVWKAAAILLERRPDLSLSFVPAPPSGLLLVTGLDPAAASIADLRGVLASWMDRPFPADPATLVEQVARIPNDEESIRGFVSRVWGNPSSA